MESNLGRGKQRHRQTKKSDLSKKKSELVREPWIVARECWIATLIHHQRPNDPKLDYYVHDKNRRTFILIPTYMYYNNKRQFFIDTKLDFMCGVRFRFSGQISS